MPRLQLTELEWEQSLNDYASTGSCTFSFRANSYERQKMIDDKWMPYFIGSALAITCLIMWALR